MVKGQINFLLAIDENNLKDYIINIGEVAWELVPNLYEISKATILPTLLESYSGIYIESMKYNKPILTSDLDFARETCQDAAIYFDPFSAEDILNKINKVDFTKMAYEEMSRKYNLILKANKNWEEITEDIMREIFSLLDDTKMKDNLIS